LSLGYDIPKKQRALVLQGGGALGAYESGALTVLCEYLSDEDKGNNEKDGPLFDIVAGTSIGAMNAAILVSNVVNRNRTWEEAAKELENFWIDEEKGLSSTPDYSEWWDDTRKEKRMFTASPEAARRYYSVKAYLKYGTPNVCSPPILDCELKFGDPDNMWYVHDSSPLQSTIERYSKGENSKDLRIATSWEKRQPRLLVIAVDVAEGKTVTFDSYHKEAEKGPKNSLYEGDGITINHIMASGTIPIFYEFREIPKEGGRKFCDGGILSNTPFRELLQAHRDYWKEVVGEDQDKIPDLDVYIINLHPSKQDKVPPDLDAAQDRINDITFSDRNSHYDEMVAELVTKYTELIDKLKELAKSHSKSKDESDSGLLNELEDLVKTTEAKGRQGAGEYNKYKDLLKAHFKLDMVIRIEAESYTDSISGKGADFTSKTIRSLIEKGKQDAQRVLNYNK
jgi:NTE family protein